MKVEGVSEGWLNNYGSKMLQKIEEFCKKKGGEMDTFPCQVPTQAQEKLEQVYKINI